MIYKIDTRCPRAAATWYYMRGGEWLKLYGFNLPSPALIFDAVPVGTVHITFAAEIVGKGRVKVSCSMQQDNVISCVFSETRDCDPTLHEDDLVLGFIREFLPAPAARVLE